MSARDKLKSEIVNKAVVHGKVILSSGKEADYYVDLRRVTLDHIAAPLVGEVMLELTKDLDYEAVGGLTLGADPVATAMMHVAARNGKAIDSFVVRKAEKAHGLQRRHAAGLDGRVAGAEQQALHGAAHGGRAFDGQVGLGATLGQHLRLGLLDAVEHRDAAGVVEVDADGQVDLVLARVLLEGLVQAQDRVAGIRLDMAEHAHAGAPSARAFSMSARSLSGASLGA